MTDPTAPAAPPSLRHSLACLLRADVAVQWRNVRSLVLSFVLPVVVLIAVNAGKRGPALGTEQFRTALAITLGVITIGVVAYSLAVARDRDDGVFQRLRATPVPVWTVMLSRILVQVVAILVMACVVLIAAAVVEHLSLGIGSYLLLAPVVVVGALVFLAIGQAIVGLIRSAETLNAIGRLLYVPLFLLSIFGNSAVLGTTVETISRWSPGGVFESLLSAALEPATWSGDTWLSLLVSAGYIVIFAGAGIRWFHWTSA